MAKESTWGPCGGEAPHVGEVGGRKHGSTGGAVSLAREVAGWRALVPTLRPKLNGERVGRARDGRVLPTVLPATAVWAGASTRSACHALAPSPHRRDASHDA